MITLTIIPVFAAAGYSLMYLLGGGGLFGAVVIFFVAKMFRKWFFPKKSGKPIVAEHVQRGYPGDARPDSTPDLWRLGACLLSWLPEPPQGLRGSLPRSSGELGIRSVAVALMRIAVMGIPIVILGGGVVEANVFGPDGNGIVFQAL
jgi:hypothetical protein